MAQAAVSGIYKITSPSGKFYIGSSFNVRKRLNEHRGNLRRKTHCNRHLQSAADKYGVDALTFELVCANEKGTLRELEQLIIRETGAHYNLTDATEEKLSALWLQADFRERNAKRASEQNKARWADPVYREANKDRVKVMQTPGLLLQASVRLKESWQDPSFREKMKAVSSRTFKKVFENPDFVSQHRERKRAELTERCKDKDFCRRRDEAAASANRRPLISLTTGEVFNSINAAASARGVSVSLINKQRRGLSTRSGELWRYLAHDERVAYGFAINSEAPGHG